MSGKETLEDRLMRKSMPVTECGCWIWLGSTRNTGYGRCGWNSGVTDAHRLSWQAFKGPIPEGLFVLHTCDMRLCINPDHLFLGTHDDNMRDRTNKGRTYRPRGELHHRALLTEADVLEIYRSVGTNASIGENFNVHRTTVYSIRNERSWKYLTNPEDINDVSAIH